MAGRARAIGSRLRGKAFRERGQSLGAARSNRRSPVRSAGGKPAAPLACAWNGGAAGLSEGSQMAGGSDDRDPATAAALRDMAAAIKTLIPSHRVSPSLAASQPRQRQCDLGFPRQEAEPALLSGSLR
jgi:hypothetical protein